MQTYAPTLRETTISRLNRLTDMLSEAGMPPSALGRIVKNDANWVSDYRNRDIRVSTYDTVLARVSAIWPAHLAWPEDVPRPKPAEIEPVAAAQAAERFSKAQPGKG